jgi:hypothetical protein
MIQNLSARLAALSAAAQLFAACGPSDSGGGQVSAVVPPVGVPPTAVTPGSSTAPGTAAPGTVTPGLPEPTVPGVTPTSVTPGATSTVPDVTPTVPGVTPTPVPPAPVTDPVPFINENGNLPAGSNTFGIVGSWYAFGDGVTSTASGNPYRAEGLYCITGEAPGDEDFAAHWGAGMGLDLNNPDGETKLPYEFTGKLTGFRMTLTGTVPAAARIHFVNNLENDVTPFVPVVLDESVVYSIADAIVPLDWDVANSGERVENGVLYSIQVMVPGAEAAGPIDLCISEFEPIYEDGGPAVVDDAFVNRDGFVLPDTNTFGIQGPVYAIGDGTSTTQSGNPYKDGKYCVAGEFTGAADAWGAGIAFDLNKAPGGGERGAYAHSGKVGGFRIKLSGNTPGSARIQFIVNEPQDGDQPFLVAQMGTTMDYRIPWAQVPTSWDVANAGLEVGDSIYTVQLYLDGTEPGPFEVCVDEFLPLVEADLGSDAPAASAGYSGFKTIDPARLAAEYALWKKRHLVECSDGVSACVPRDEGDCISEGIGYGMLLAVGFDDQPTFDKLWTYYNNHKGSTGMMDWQSSQCGATQQGGWATDGDIDVAFALYQASCKWGTTYLDDAKGVLTNIKNSSIEICNGKLLVKPGNFGGCNGSERHTNPSYLATAYFKVFATITGDATWTTLVDDSYTHLATVQGKMNGLVPDWADPAGNIPSGDRGQYGPDASRTPWRVATDYVWFQEPRAVTYLDNVYDYVEGAGGISRAQTPNSNYRGALAMSALQKDAATAQAYTDAWLTTSVDDESYFPGTLRPVYMLLLANQFPHECN